MQNILPIILTSYRKATEKLYQTPCFYQETVYLNQVYCIVQHFQKGLKSQGSIKSRLLYYLQHGGGIASFLCKFL